MFRSLVSDIQFSTSSLTKDINSLQSLANGAVLDTGKQLTLTELEQFDCEKRITSPTQIPNKYLTLKTDKQVDPKLKVTREVLRRPLERGIKSIN